MPRSTSQSTTMPQLVSSPTSSVVETIARAPVAPDRSAGRSRATSRTPLPYSSAAVTAGGGLRHDRHQRLHRGELEHLLVVIAPSGQGEREGGRHRAYSLCQPARLGKGTGSDVDSGSGSSSVKTRPSRSQSASSASTVADWDLAGRLVEERRHGVRLVEEAEHGHLEGVLEGHRGPVEVLASADQDDPVAEVHAAEPGLDVLRHPAGASGLEYVAGRVVDAAVRTGEQVTELKEFGLGQVVVARVLGVRFKGLEAELGPVATSGRQSSGRSPGKP
ncbi:hypothetical protein ACQEWB_00210 [Streptomyces sp. CA-249302]|uniref:hypothetical protein n=1 Tax=Streptomyces sp. CA-249302 TaxID=3240058 RepID=UPI003D89D593